MEAAFLKTSVSLDTSLTMDVGSARDAREDAVNAMETVLTAQHVSHTSLTQLPTIAANPSAKLLNSGT